MADSNSRADSARHNIIEFPARPKRGRVRRSQSMDAAGDLTLMLLGREGIEPPPNVASLQPPPEPTPVEKSPELALLLGISARSTTSRRTRSAPPYASRPQAFAAHTWLGPAL